MDAFQLFVMPVGLGLLGFIEPCTIGSSVLFIQYMEGASAGEKLACVAVFAVVRAVVVGALGALAALVGAAFIGFQKAAWVLLGALYIVLGLPYMSGQAGLVMRSLGPGLRSSAGARGSAALAVLFGLNIPACAAPLLFAVLGLAAVGAAAQAASIVTGFVSLALFGLALSLPLAVAVLWMPAWRALNALAALGAKRTGVTGAVFVVLGAWSVYFGLFVTPGA
jgi:cytochrome c-type biogenesis protein